MIDRQGDPATELAVAELIAEGEIHRHTRKAMRLYAERRGLLMARFFRTPSARTSSSFSRPAVWRSGYILTVRSTWESSRTPGRRNFVSFLSGSAFAMTDAPVEAARLGFGSMNADELRQAVGRLREARRAI